jgi:hypothetical protein
MCNFGLSSNGITSVTNIMKTVLELLYAYRRTWTKTNFRKPVTSSNTTQSSDARRGSSVMVSSPPPPAMYYYKQDSGVKMSIWNIMKIHSSVPQYMWPKISFLRPLLHAAQSWRDGMDGGAGRIRPAIRRFSTPALQMNLLLNVGASVLTCFSYTDLLTHTRVNLHLTLQWSSTIANRFPIVTTTGLLSIQSIKKCFQHFRFCCWKDKNGRPAFAWVGLPRHGMCLCVGSWCILLA